MLNSHDKQGRPWAKLSEIKPGDTLIPDGGFTCMRARSKKTVYQQGNELYVTCSDSREKHFLRGQADDGEHLVGFYKESTSAPST